MSSLHVDQAHPAAEAVAAMNAALDDFADAPLWSMPARELADLVVQLERAANRLDAAQSRASRKLKNRCVARCWRPGQRTGG
jgi:hypothetical protein